MTIAATRRQLLKLCGATTISGALAGALRAEGMDKVVADPASATALPFALTTPVHVGAVALRVKDLAMVETYYVEMLGLSVITRGEDQVSLGSDGTALLHLIHKPQADYEDPRSAGLYHTAFLMPSRKDLARWLVHVAMNKFPIVGFADHAVSEAVYLADPEGNGVEVYSDRPRERWEWKDGVVTMGTEALNIDDIVAETDTTRDDYTEAPMGLRIGHIHLRVGEVDAARGFYEKALGLASTRGNNRAGAAFLSSGGYHHHVAVNVWQSEGAGKREESPLGLDWFSLRVTTPDDLAAQKERLVQAGHATRPLVGGIESEDPWGTRVRLMQG